MFATLRKELLLLLRDPGGLLLLMIMPAFLIVVMAMVQDAPFKDYQEIRFEMLVVNNDKGSVGKKILTALKSNKNFIVIDSLEGQVLSEPRLKEAIQNGKSKIGIIIPENATSTLVSTANRLANDLSQAAGVPDVLPVAGNGDSSFVRILFDPVTKPAFRSSLRYATDQFINKIKMELLIERLSGPAGKKAPVASVAAFDMFSVKEQQVGEGLQLRAALNSVQHNVPAWAIFGMFLIVIPMSGNMIRERDEGSALRLQLIPNVARSVAMGKLLFYVLLCMVQFAAMLLVGIYLLPVLGLPRLFLGDHPLALIPMVAAVAFSATAYGYFIGNIFKTANQAMPFGAISVVLLSAIGGVWVPVEILPQTMQHAARISPQYWSLQGVNQVMLRGASFSGIIQSFSIVCCIGIILSLLAVWFRKK